MNRDKIYDAIELEREKQELLWGETFDSKNTPNDWVAYLTHYVGKSVTMPLDVEKFRYSTLKVAALCVAMLERTEYAKRHYDN